MSVEVQSLSKIYGQQKAVNNISFSVAPGDILGFLGPNGAGKSTTMKIATAYLPASEGSIKVCGFDVAETPMEVRKRIGYLPEHNPLYLDMYVREYLQFIASLHQIKGKAMRQRIDEMVELCGLEREQHKLISALSKGYRQRVGLAQALLHDPEVLILDEPTTGLDPNQIKEIRSLIKNISKEKTVIFSTHIMQEVQALCNRVIIINKGEIVMDSSTAALSASSSQKIVKVELAAPVSTEALLAIDGVNHVEQEGSVYRLHSDANADIRAAVVAFVNTHNAGLLGLSQEESSMEAIFHQLTAENHSEHV